MNQLIRILELKLSNYSLQQLINEPTHITGNSSFCIDLWFYSQPNLVTESGIHHVLHPNCYHRIIYAKFKLKVYYPPPYEREVWDYQNVDFNAIKNATTEFSWERAFENLSIDEKVYFFQQNYQKHSQTIFLNYNWWQRSTLV